MKEIEFKAYIKDINKTVDVYYIDTLQEEIGFMHPITTAFTYRSFKDIILMVYLGKKNENGEKIFVNIN